MTAEFRAFGRRRFRLAVRAVSVALAGLGGLAATAVMAQPVERNLPPPPPQASSAVIAAPPPPGSISDDRALGANLATIVILGPTSPALGGPLAPGVDTSAASRLNHPGVRAVLGRFLGRPISRKLINQVETAIVREYRRQGFPFVQVSTPEQEITGGVLQIRVVEFRAGKVEVGHAKGEEAGYVRHQIRTRPGDEIDATSLSQDLDWLNRIPGRTVTPTFTPGAALGQTDLDLNVVHSRPWSLTAGYANSGSPLTGEDRFFIGGSIAGHVLTDALLSVQITGSPDFWATRGLPFQEGNPRYASVAGRLLVATAPRQDVELTVDAVQTNESVFPFRVRQRTLEATLAYRSAVSNLVPLPGDVSVGLEVSHQGRDTYFGPFLVLQGEANVYQLYGDWSNHWTDRLGATALVVSVHGSPGGVDRFNTSAAFADFTNGRVLKAAYVYGEASLTRQTLLPHGFSVLTTFSGQYAGVPVPDSQQIALGGQTAGRGYSLDDGGWDDGAVLRNELRTPQVQLASLGPLLTSLSGRVFADYGWGRSEAERRNVNAASVGLGADLRLGWLAVASVDVSRPLIDGRFTRAEDLHLDARLTFAY
jgi:hemolysin activation/secretion protein